MNLRAYALCLLLCACADLSPSTHGGAAPTSSASAAGPPPASLPQSEALLRYAYSLRHRNNNELNHELDNLNRAWQQQRSEDNRLKLAVFHALTPNGDRARALALLDLPSNDSNGRGRNHPIATLLLPLLQDYRRSEDNHAGLQQKLRDEQKRADALQQKLDALRDIEKKMIERAPAKP